MTYGSLAALVAASLIQAAPPQAAPPVAGPADGPTALVLIAPSPISDRVARSTTIVTGKVTSIEEKSVKATSFPGADDKVEYLIAVVKIDDAVLGAKGLTHVKVGFMAPQAGGPGRPIRPGLGRGQAKLEKDQEVLLFLTPHHNGEFETMQAYFSVVDKKADTYEKDVEAAKKYVKLLAEPEKGLKSKDATERLETASMLVAKFRTAPPSKNGPKEAPIDADLSKLIMNALADADWTPPKPGGPRGNFQLMPVNVFFQLGVNEKDGWKPPQDGTKFNEYVETWVKENKDKYRIKQFVAEKEEKKDDKKGK
jgi:hypothetical protein